MIADDLTVVSCTSKRLCNWLSDEFAAAESNGEFALVSSAQADAHAQTSNAAADLKTIVGIGVHAYAIGALAL